MNCCHSLLIAITGQNLIATAFMFLASLFGKPSSCYDPASRTLRTYQSQTYQGIGKLGSQIQVFIYFSGVVFVLAHVWFITLDLFIGLQLQLLYYSRYKSSMMLVFITCYFIHTYHVQMNVVGCYFGQKTSDQNLEYYSLFIDIRQYVLILKLLFILICICICNFPSPLYLSVSLGNVTFDIIRCFVLQPSMPL